MSEQHAFDENTPAATGADETVVNLDTAAAAPAADKTAELEAKLAESNDKLLRTLAEMENVRRRAERDRQDVSKFAISGFARDLLGVADNLRRALQAITPEQREANESLKNIFTGVEATERELLRLFEQNGIKKVDPIDQKFDPNLHEVMFEAEIPGKAPGTVIQVIEAGFTIHDRLLRPARVGVAKGDDTAATGRLDTQA